MNRDWNSSRSSIICHAVGYGFACLALVLSFSRVTMCQSPSEAEGTAAGSVAHVTHLLGLEEVRNNTKGQLRIEGDIVRFQRDGTTVAQVRISSIQDISLETEDRQIGGMPVMLGKAAVPFEGGRAISLFSHKKFDILTVEYFDDNGGFHGAIFEMNKGEGKSFETDLAAKGAHIASPEGQVSTQKTPEIKAPEVKQ